MKRHDRVNAASIIGHRPIARGLAMAKIGDIKDGQGYKVGEVHSRPDYEGSAATAGVIIVGILTLGVGLLVWWIIKQLWQGSQRSAICTLGTIMMIGAVIFNVIMLTGPNREVPFDEDPIQWVYFFATIGTFLLGAIIATTSIISTRRS
jgi:hypothetical protein